MTTEPEPHCKQCGTHFDEMFMGSGALYCPGCEEWKAVSDIFVDVWKHGKEKRVEG